MSRSCRVEPQLGPVRSLQHRHLLLAVFNAPRIRDLCCSSPATPLLGFQASSQKYQLELFKPRVLFFS